MCEGEARVCGMPSIDEIAEEYVARAAALDPFMATCAGIGGHDHELPDLSADGFAGRAGLDRSTLAALDAAEAPALREQIARAAMRERLAVAVDLYDAGDTTSELNVSEGWVQYVRQLFDLMPTDGEEAAATATIVVACVVTVTRFRPGLRDRVSGKQEAAGTVRTAGARSGLGAEAYGVEEAGTAGS